MLCGLTFKPSFLTAQTENKPDSVLLLADFLYDRQQYDDAVTEFLRFSFLNAHHPLKFYADFMAGISYSKMSEWDRAVQCFRTAKETAPEFFIPMIQYQTNIGLIGGRQWSSASVEFLKQIQKPASPEYKRFAQLCFLIIQTHEENWKSAEKIVQQMLADSSNSDSSLVQSLTQLAFQIEFVQKSGDKSLGKAKLLSTVVPGTGQIYSGEILSGLNAFLLNAGTSYLLYDAVRDKRGLDFALIFSFLWYRYYTGNRQHAAEAATNFNIDRHRHIIALIDTEIIKMSETVSPINKIWRRNEVLKKLNNEGKRFE